MPAEIKPCPFCGSKIDVSDIALDDRVVNGVSLHDDYGAVYMSCPVCKCGMGIEEESLPEIFTVAVIEKWNRRADAMEGARQQPTTNKGQNTGSAVGS